MELTGIAKDTYDIGERVEYQCKPGYKRRPSEAMFTMCSAEDNWPPLSNDACYKKLCTIPVDPLNGQVNFLNGSYEFGTEIQFVCNRGFNLIGNEILVCELSGSGVQWSSEAPVCEKVLCQPPPDIANGGYLSKKDVFEFLEVVTYSCDHNPGGDQFSLIGESSLHCMGRNVWSGSPPECKVVRCLHPVVPNGRQMSGFRAKHFYGATVTFECREGFFLHGDSMVVCEADSTWQPPLPRCLQEPALLTTNIPGTQGCSARSTPRLQKKLRFLPSSLAWSPVSTDACYKNYCDLQVDPVHGQVILVNKSYEFGSQIQFVCNDGFYLVGNEILHCLLNGSKVHWSGEAPLCEKVSCQPPPQIPNGGYSSAKDVFQYLESVTYSCSRSAGPEEFSLVGERKLFCLGQHVWSSSPPECKVVSCPQPVVLNGRQRSGFGVKHSYRARVTFECLHGFFLHGNSTVVCSADSTWQPPAPQCRDTPPARGLHMPASPKVFLALRGRAGGRRF
ncbi:membrane cofactor protein-like [Octodon degus]|uniref:Membrane cofactor protein n=1 Tax=Octodon degus TaxID=10160 RepID=A0A6P6ED94_OCTDE|nr:membrane cofactor protein-like [Octodon degus]